MPIPRASNLAVLRAASSVMLRLASHNGTLFCQRRFRARGSVRVSGQFVDCRCVGSPRARRLCRTEPCAQSGVGISSPNPALLLPSLCAVVPPRRCGWCGGSCCGAPARKPNNISAVAVLRLDGVRGDADGVASLQHRVPRTRPLFDMGTCGAALRLPNTLSAHRITEELVDSKVLLEGAYSADQRSAVRWNGDRSSHSWSDGASLTVVLLLSLGSGRVS